MPANYPGAFNARENRLISHNYALVEIEDEEVVLSSDDSTTHVLMSSTVAADPGATPPVLASVAKLVLPKPVLSKGRLINVRVEDTTGTVAIEDAEGNVIQSDAAVGNYQYFCTGSEYKRVF